MDDRKRLIANNSTPALQEALVKAETERKSAIADLAARIRERMARPVRGRVTVCSTPRAGAWWCDEADTPSPTAQWGQARGFGRTAAAEEWKMEFHGQWVSHSVAGWDYDPDRAVWSHPSGVTVTQEAVLSVGKVCNAIGELAAALRKETEDACVNTDELAGHWDRPAPASKAEHDAEVKRIRDLCAERIRSRLSRAADVATQPTACTQCDGTGKTPALFLEGAPAYDCTRCGGTGHD